MKTLLKLIFIVIFISLNLYADNVQADQDFKVYRCYDMLKDNQLKKSYCLFNCIVDQEKSILRFNYSDKTNIKAIIRNPSSGETNEWNFKDCKFVDQKNWECKNKRYDEHKDSLFIDVHKMINGNYFDQYSVGIKEDCILKETDDEVNQCFEENKVRDFIFEEQFSNCAFPIK